MEIKDYTLKLNEKTYFQLCTEVDSIRKELGELRTKLENEINLSHVGFSTGVRHDANIFGDQFKAEHEAL